VKLAFLALALLLPQEKGEAEEIFFRMERKIRQAKTLHFKLNGVIQPNRLKLTGEVCLGDANQVRLDLEGRNEEETRLKIFISDGNQVRIAAHDGNDAFPAVEDLGLQVRTQFARLGLVAGIDVSYAAQRRVNESHLHSRFALGAREKVGDRAAQAIHFSQRGEFTRESSDIVLWIDVETHLP
jgi:outer membrane lipoprotein-sorting protein